MIKVPHDEQAERATLGAVLLNNGCLPVARAIVDAQDFYAGKYRHVFEAMEYPWYGIRPAPRPIDMMAEVDNYARIKFDGRNPFWGDKWEQLLGCAQADARAKGPNVDPMNTTNTVGEDSAFTDKAKALGFRIVVQTNAICGHVDKRILWPQDHVDSMKKVKASEEKACGILE